MLTKSCWCFTKLHKTALYFDIEFNCSCLEVIFHKMVLHYIAHRYACLLFLGLLLGAESVCCLPRNIFLAPNSVTFRVLLSESNPSRHARSSSSRFLSV